MADYIKFSKGLFAVNKPKGWTSAKVVNYIKKYSDAKCVGHGGTLDPFAEGVLVIGIGREYTKKLTEILNCSKKEYIAEIILNQKSDTYDITGNVSEIILNEVPSLEKIFTALNNFIGEIWQTPPPYSAIKISGKRACDLLRKNKISYNEMENIIKPKKVVINNIEIIEYKFPSLVLKINCMSGVYIRSLANDLGKKLHTGGILKSLIRTQVADFKLNDCIKIEP